MHSIAGAGSWSKNLKISPSYFAWAYPAKIRSIEAKNGDESEEINWHCIPPDSSLPPVPFSLSLIPIPHLANLWHNNNNNNNKTGGDYHYDYDYYYYYS